MHLTKILAASASIMLTLFAGPLAAADLAVGISRSMDKFEGTLNGQKIVIMRNQDQKNTVNPAFAKTSRKCPPFCIQPSQLSPGVETIGELELISYVEQMAAGDDSIVLIDSRTPNWVAKGTIPGAINIPWTKLNPAKGADQISIGEILTNNFGAQEIEGLWDFKNAKTLVMFCNGLWCGQSSMNIKTLAKLGYPTDKIKWYRGGMQDWVSVGLTTVKP